VIAVRSGGMITILSALVSVLSFRTPRTAASLMDADSANGKPGEAHAAPAPLTSSAAWSSDPPRAAFIAIATALTMWSIRGNLTARVTRLMVRDQAARGLTSLSIRRRKVRSATSKS
jgi:hypothetical protein